MSPRCCVGEKPEFTAPYDSEILSVCVHRLWSTQTHTSHFEAVALVTRKNYFPALIIRSRDRAQALVTFVGHSLKVRCNSESTSNDLSE